MNQRASDLLFTWLTVKLGDGKDRTESSYSSIVREMIWLNNDITFKGKSLLYKNWIKSEILFIGNNSEGKRFLRNR